MKALPGIDSCTNCALGRLSEACPFHEVRRSAGTILLEQGERPTRVWLVRRGTVLLTSVSPAGEETLCALRGPGSLLGLESLRERTTLYQAWALSDVTLCGLGSDSFRGWVGTEDTPMGAVARLAIDEAGHRGEERIALAGKAVVRLARFLLDRRRMEGRDRPLRVQNQVLARMLGMRAETLSRALTQLRDSGAIARGPGVRIIDAVALEAVAGESDAEAAAAGGDGADGADDADD